MRTLLGTPEDLLSSRPLVVGDVEYLRPVEIYRILTRGHEGEHARGPRRDFEAVTLEQWHREQRPCGV